MTKSFGAKFGTTWQPYSSVSPRSAGISGTCKRKRAGDEFGSLPTSGSYSEVTKRRKYVDDCHESTVRGSRENFPREGSIGDESSEDEGSQSQLMHSLSYQTPLDTNIKPPARCPSVSADEAVLSKVTKETRTARRDTLPVSNRKRSFIYTPDDGTKEKMRQVVHDVNKLFNLCSEDDCWLHPSPPPARTNGRPMGTIHCNFVWKDSVGKQRLRVNVGIVALVIECQLTEEQMEGYVKESWHLSHLCGNWTCCNWRHMTVENGRTNISRNQCFRDATHCSHDPPCMKDRKRRLLVTPAISNQIREAIESTSHGTKTTVGYQYSNTPTDWSGCRTCGSILCYANATICPSLTSITKSQETLEKLELCIQPSDEVLKAIAYLKQIIVDLVREKEASDAASLENAVAQREVDQSAHWSQKQFSSYGQMLGFLLD